MMDLIKAGAKYRYYTVDGWNVISAWTKAKDVEFDNGDTLEEYIITTNTGLITNGVNDLSIFNNTWDS